MEYMKALVEYIDDAQSEQDLGDLEAQVCEIWDA